MAIKHVHQYPTLNTQSCIKGLLVVQDFCFRAIWAAGPVHEKKLGADYEGVIFQFFGVKFIFLNVFENNKASVLKSCIID